MAQAAHGSNYLNAQKGLWSWLTTLDHKRIGILYFISVMTFFLMGGIAALLLRGELFAYNAVDAAGKVTAEENYLRESILNSQAKIVKGFGPRSAMPAFQGQLSEVEVTALIEYIKGLK